MDYHEPWKETRGSGAEFRGQWGPRTATGASGRTIPQSSGMSRRSKSARSAAGQTATLALPPRMFTCSQLALASLSILPSQGQPMMDWSGGDHDSSTSPAAPNCREHTSKRSTSWATSAIPGCPEAVLQGLHHHGQLHLLEVHAGHQP